MRKQLLIIIIISFVIICGYLIWNNQKTNTSINIKDVNQQQENNINTDNTNVEILSLIAILESRSILKNINTRLPKKHEIEEFKKHEAERIKAVKKLRELKAREALEVFERIAMDNTESDWLRDQAMRGLGEIGGEQYIPIFSSVLEDINLDVNLRITAIFVLGKFNSIEAVETLAKGVHDKDYIIRFKSIQCLGETKNPVAIQYILDGLNDVDMSVKRRSIRSLAEIGDPSAIPYIKQVLQKTNDSLIKETCLGAINKLEQK